MTKQQIMIKNALSFSVSHTDRWPELQAEYKAALALFLREQNPALLSEQELKDLIHSTRNQCQALELEFALRQKKQ